jgi:DNA repair exonuclease SbcCD ATPase subunit
MADFDFFTGDFLQPLPQQHSAYPLPTTYSTPTSALSPLSSAPFDASSKKRKAEDSLASVQHLDASVQHLDEHGRVAAEEDKRRRNTAASARFRVKKKQREQALEKSAKEMSDRVTHLETKIQQLETENAWLKSLITEKSGGKSSTDELKALISQREESQAGRSSPAHVEGVGTKA